MNLNQTLSHSGSTDSAVSEREYNHGALARQIAVAGMVLLKNDGLLPLKKQPIALLGSGAVKTVKGGIGSGDVNNRATVSVYQSFAKYGIPIVNTQWLDEYEACYTKAREDWRDFVLSESLKYENCFDAYSFNPFVIPEGRPVTTDDLKGAEAAVYVISRISGEGKDRLLVEGDYYLSRQERETLELLNDQKIPTVLVLNAGGIVELTDILERCPMIQAVLNACQPGQEAGDAITDVLFGKYSPCGHLTATWPKRYADIPYALDFSYLNGDLTKELYKDGIFVGYRYFDSYGVEPLFPFGHGLSYCTFLTELMDITVEDGSYFVHVAVKNTGTYFASEVVQLYASLPQSGMAKELRRLVGFGKTSLLEPGQKEVVKIGLDSKALACFDPASCSWVVQKGLYGLWISRSIADGELSCLLKVDADTVIETTNDCFPLPEPMEELGASDTAAQREAQWLEEGNGLEVFDYVPQPVVHTPAPVPYAAEQPVSELIPLLYGNITEGASTLGNAGTRVPGSAGETSEALEEKYGIQSLIMADGPAGLRLRPCYQVDKATDRVYGLGVFGALEGGFLEPMTPHDNAQMYYQYCTAFPVGTVVAQTWDVKLIEKFGEAVAREMDEFHVNLWLAPGMNIQRNPLCGRNFEYFSEDPLLSGMVAAAITKGVQQHKGCGVTIKHFSGNNQEDNRMSVDARISQRAMREIYLRGFEIAVKTAQPKAIMTSYNLVNGIHSANSYDLCTTVARNEWGFGGMIMTDWNTTVPEDGSAPWMCAAVGNDVIMPGNPNDDRNIRQALADGRLHEEAVRTSAGRVIALSKELTR